MNRAHLLIILSILCFIAFIILVVGLGTPVEADNPLYQSKRIISELAVSIIRHVDLEAGVVCYSHKQSMGGGIDCLPIGDTHLDKSWGRHNGMDF